MQQVYFKSIKLGVKNTGYVYNRQTGLTFRVQTQPYKNQQTCGTGAPVFIFSAIKQFI